LPLSAGSTRSVSRWSPLAWSLSTNFICLMCVNLFHLVPLFPFISSSSVGSTDSIYIRCLGFSLCFFCFTFVLLAHLIQSIPSIFVVSTELVCF
jgi:hypothetical protein